MLIAAFHLGVFDGKRLLLPTEEPWPRFVIPKENGSLIIEYFYLLAGREDEHMWNYLWDDSFNGVTARS